jgi:hypothetical protein
MRPVPGTGRNRELRARKIKLDSFVQRHATDIDHVIRPMNARTRGVRSARGRRGGSNIEMFHPKL